MEITNEQIELLDCIFDYYLRGLDCQDPEQAEAINLKDIIQEALFRLEGLDK